MTAFDMARDTAERFFTTLDSAEVVLVARVVRGSERLGLARVARTATRAGNGTLYPFLSLVFIAGGRIGSPLRFLVASAISIAVALLVYPPLKRFLARSRPSDYDRSLACPLDPLDRYSCPSGHTMTAVAYGTSLAFAAPAALPFAVALCAVIAWARIATGHHYPTDVLAGAALGGTIAATVAVFVL